MANHNKLICSHMGHPDCSPSCDHVKLHYYDHTCDVTVCSALSIDGVACIPIDDASKKVKAHVIAQLLKGGQSQ